MSQRTVVKRERWSALEKIALIRAHKANKSPTEVFRENTVSQPPRSWQGIVRMWRLLFGSKTCYRPKKGAHQWTEEAKKLFDEYIRHYSDTETPEQIANLWHIHPNTVIKWQIRLFVRPTRKQVLAMSYSQSKQNHGRARQRQAILSKSTTWRQRTYKELVELAQKLREKNNPPEEQVCRSCKFSWPKRKKFYRFNEYHTNMGTQRWYRKDCVLCEHAKRATKDRRATG